MTIQDTLPRELHFTNRQRSKRLDADMLRRISEAALARLPGVNGWNLSFHFVGARRMGELNKGHLGHYGPTDVITLDYADHDLRKPEFAGRSPEARTLVGEVYICVDVALTQAREFRTTWQCEVVRYIVHGLLHLCGHDDSNPVARGKMKRKEDVLMRRLARQFKLDGISRLP